LVTKGVVDFLEAVEVQEQHSHGVARTGGRAQGYPGPILEQGAVRQVSQRVVQRLIPVTVTFEAKVSLVAAHDHCPADDQADGRDQRDKVDKHHETSNAAD
jgi:hypothetical protein